MLSHNIAFKCFVQKKLKMETYLANSTKALGYTPLQSGGIIDTINARMDFMRNVGQYQTKRAQAG